MRTETDSRFVSRRAFVRGSAVAAAGAALGIAAPSRRRTRARRRARIPIALQLYSVRDDAAQDLPGVLGAVAEMGYEGVEFAGYYDHAAEELRSMLDDVGLKVAGAHMGLESLGRDQIRQTVEFHQTIGNKFLIVPGLAEDRRNSADAWLETAQYFNTIARQLAPYGMRTGYHNHAIEFAPMDGKVPWDIFFGNTIDDVVMQLDTGNARHGGADPIVFLERYPGRTATIHLKEYSADNPQALLGEGEIPWEDVFRICETTGGTEWYIVEQESYAYPPLECAARCLENLRAMGGQ